jgi:hypothetical protein
VGAATESAHTKLIIALTSSRSFFHGEGTDISPSWLCTYRNGDQVSLHLPFYDRSATVALLANRVDYALNSASNFFSCGRQVHEHIFA